MNVRDLVRAMEGIAPTRFAAEWDNVGLLVGDERAPLSRVLLAIDCTPEVLDEARRTRADAVVAYHPPVFAPLKRLREGNAAFEAARAGIAIYSPHTALDAAEGGTNDVLADAIGMTDRRALQPVAPAAAGKGALGMGRVGPIAPGPVALLVDRIKLALGIRVALVAGPMDREASVGAVCAGSGADLLADALAAGAHVFLTGEVSHHDALRAAANGLTVVCTLHSASERPALVALERALAARLEGVAIARSEADRDPFTFA